MAIIATINQARLVFGAWGLALVAIPTLAIDAVQT